jgi:hypothetical protein
MWGRPGGARDASRTLVAAFIGLNVIGMSLHPAADLTAQPSRSAQLSPAPVPRDVVLRERDAAASVAEARPE